MEPIKIELDLFDLQYNKNIKKLKHHMVLTDTQLVYVIECYMDVYPKPDDDLGVVRHEEYCNQVDHIRKKDIYWIKSAYSPKMEVWSLEIFFGNEDTYCNFETEEKLRVVERQILDWLDGFTK